MWTLTALNPLYALTPFHRDVVGLTDLLEGRNEWIMPVCFHK